MMGGTSGWQVYGEMWTERRVRRHWEAVIPRPGMEREEMGWVLEKVPQIAPQCQVAPCLGRLAVSPNCSNVDTAFLPMNAASRQLDAGEILQVSRLQTSTEPCYMVTPA